MLRKRTPYTKTKLGKDNRKHMQDCGCNRCFHKVHKSTKKIRENDKNPYYAYIKSSQWTRRKELYYQTHKRQCQACGSYRDIDLHHMIYKDFGKERDETLVCLCRVCHKDFHLKNKMSKYLMDSTLQYIRNKQSTLRSLKKYIEIL